MSPSVMWQKLVAWETSSSVPFLGSQSHRELIVGSSLHPLLPILLHHCGPGSGLIVSPRLVQQSPASLHSPCCQTFLPKLRFSHTRFMLGHKTQPCLASPPGLVSIVLVSLCSQASAPGAGSRGQEPLQQDCPPQEGGKQGAAGAQFLLPKALSLWGAMSAGGEQRPAVTVTTTVTNHVITISCRVEMWSPRRRLSRPLTYLSSRLSIPHTPCSSHCSPLPPLGEGRHFSHLLSCCIVPFSQPAVPCGQFLFVTHLSLKCHLPFRVFVYIS